MLPRLGLVLILNFAAIGSTLAQQLSSRADELQAHIQSLVAKLGPGKDRATCAGYVWGCGSPADEAAVELAIIGEPCVDYVLPLLKDPSAWRRIFAINILERVHDHRAVAPIIDILQSDPEGPVRSHAASALERLGDRAACAALIAGLADTDKIVAALCAEALGEFREARAIPDLINLLGSYIAMGGPIHFPDPPEKARNALARMGKPAESALIGALRNPNEYVREHAAQALGQMRCKAAVSDLIRLMDDVEEDVVSAAAQALGKIGDKRACDRLLKEARSNIERRSTAAVLALGDLGDERALTLIQGLIDGKDEALRDNAAHALCRFRSPRAVSPIARVITDIAFESAWDRSMAGGAAATALGEIGGPVAENVLLTALRDREPGIRADAARALGKLRVRRALEPLSRLMSDSEYFVKDSAAEAMGRIDRQYLIDLFQRSNKRARTYILGGIAALKNPADVPFFLGLVNESELGDWAIRGLETLGAVEALPRLILLLKDPRCKDEPFFRSALVTTISALQEIERTGRHAAND